MPPPRVPPSLPVVRGGRRTLGRERPGALGSIVHGRAASDPALTVALGCTHRPGGVEVAVSRHQLLAVHRHAPSTAVGGIDLELMAEDDAVPAFLRSGPHAFRVLFAEPPGGVTPYESMARGGCHLSPDCGTGPERTLPPRVAGAAWAGRPRRGGRPRPRSRRCGGTPRSAPGPARRALSRRSVRRTFDAIVLEGFAYLRAELERLAGKGGDDHDGQHVREAAHVERPGCRSSDSSKSGVGGDRSPTPSREKDSRCGRNDNGSGVSLEARSDELNDQRERYRHTRRRGRRRAGTCDRAAATLIPNVRATSTEPVRGRSRFHCLEDEGDYRGGAGEPDRQLPRPPRMVSAARNASTRTPAGVYATGTLCCSAPLSVRATGVVWPPAHGRAAAVPLASGMAEGNPLPARRMQRQSLAQGGDDDVE